MTSSFLVTLRLLLGGLLLFTFILPAPTAARQRPAAQQPHKSKRVVWAGYWEDSAQYTGPLGDYFNIHEYEYQRRANFIYVQEIDANGSEQWVSGKVTWSAYGKSTAIVTGAGETCKGSGTIELKAQRPGRGAPSVGITIPCYSNMRGRVAMVGAFVPPPHDFPGFGPCTPKPDECTCRGHSKSVTSVPYYENSFFTTVSPQYDAVMEVKTDRREEYWNFVPEPGKTITFSVHSNIPVRFRFELKKEEVSHFPGYAMNANVDDEFFRRSHLEHLKGNYKNDDPDLVFDPKMYEGAAWKQPIHQDVVETAKESTSATVTVTAMDFGAYGKLRASAIPGGTCRAEQPVRILVDGKEQADPFVTIPLDRDGSFIAERMKEPKNGITEWGYKGEPGLDNDQNPNVEHPGDGFTTFEEYRGFMTSNVDADPTCRDESKDLHVRTNPSRKDLFVCSPDPVLAKMARFLSDKGVDVHIICPRHLLGPPGDLKKENNERARIVNFTLQTAWRPDQTAWRPEPWTNNKTITQESPQHGIYLINGKPNDGDDGDSDIGPPKNVNVVRIRKDHILSYNGPIKGLPWLADTVFHELGHAMGVNHHGDGNIKGDVVIVGMNSCPVDSDGNPSFSGTVNGKTACRLSGIAVRHGQNSGDWRCPMRYRIWNWYVPPSTSSLRPLGTVEFDYVLDHTPIKRSLPGYEGQVMPYDKKTDWTTGGLGDFCNSKRGTGLNGAPGDGNHAGDATNGACIKQIHINDVR